MFYLFYFFVCVFRWQTQEKSPSLVPFRTREVFLFLFFFFNQNYFGHICPRVNNVNYLIFLISYEGDPRFGTQLRHCPRGPCTTRHAVCSRNLGEAILQPQRNVTRNLKAGLHSINTEHWWIWMSFYSTKTRGEQYLRHGHSYFQLEC